MGARAMVGAMGAPLKRDDGEVSPEFIGRLLASSSGFARTLGTAAQKKAKARATNATLLASAPADTTGQRASDAAAAARRSADRVRVGGTFLGGSY